jgi:hypothetical protein
MSCRRISRELIERFRFGEELDSRSVPHLAHLADCASCREEVGLDRSLVLQLQRALRARVSGHEPSPRAFNAVRIRALAEDEPVSWRARFFRLARLMPAGAAMALMLAAVVNVAGDRQPTLLQARTVAWPGVMERADNDPLTPHEAEWWVIHQAPPPIPPPATGIMPSADPTANLGPADLPKPATGLTE